MRIENEINKKMKKSEITSTQQFYSFFEEGLFKYRLNTRKNLSLLKKSKGTTISDRTTQKVSPMFTLVPLALGFSQFLLNDLGSQKSQSFLKKLYRSFTIFNQK